MIAITVQVAGGVAVFLYILVARAILSEVALKETHKEAPFEKKSLAAVANGIAASVLALLILPLTLIPNLFSTVSLHVVANGKWYVLLFVLGSVAVTWNNVDNETLTGVDALITEFGPPFVEDLLFHIGNALRLIGNAVIPILNLLSSPARIFTTEAFTLALTCTAADLQQMVIAFFEILEESVLRWAEFIVGLGVEDFQFTPIGRKFGAFVDTFQPLVFCFCEDLSPVAAPFFAGFGESSPLWPAIDRAINFVISVIRLFFRTLWFFLTTAVLDDFTICPGEDFIPLGSPNVAGQGIVDQATCFAEREPRFDEIAEDACLTVIHTLDWIDVFPAATFDELFIVLGVNLPNNAQWPPISALVSPWLCVPIDLVRDTLNSVTHLDLLVVDEVNLQFILLDTTFAHAYNFSQGIQDFFDAPDVSFISNTGCVFAELSNVTIHAVNLFTRTVLFAVGHFPKDVGDFWETELEPITEDINRDATDFSDCINALASEISPALGDLLKEIALLVGDLVQFFNAFITSIFQDDVEDFLTAQSTRDDLIEIFDDIRAIFVALGNLIRTGQLFEDDFGSCTVGSFRDFPTDPIIVLPDPACCFGGNVDAFGRFVTNLFEWVFMSTLELSSGISFEDVVTNGGIGDLQVRVIPRSDDVIASFGCWLGTPFVGVICTDAGAKFAPPQTLELFSVGANFAAAATTLLNITGIPPFILQTQALRITDCVLKAIALGSNCGLDCVCQCVIVFYDIGVAMQVQVFTAGLQLIECARDFDDDFFEIFVEFGDAVDGLLGWDGPSSPFNVNLRDELCNAIEAIVDFILFVILFFTNIEQFFEELFAALEALLEELIKILVGSALDLIETLGCIFDEIGGGFQDILDGLPEWLAGFSEQVVDCITDLVDLTPGAPACDPDLFIERFNAFPLGGLPQLLELLSDPFQSAPICPNFPADDELFARDDSNLTLVQFNLFNVSMVNPQLAQSPCNPIWLQIMHARNVTPDIPPMTLANDLERCVVSHLYGTLIDRFVFFNIESAFGAPAIFPALAFYSSFVGWQAVSDIWTGMKGGFSALTDPQWPHVNETAFFEAHNTTSRKLIGRTYLVTQIWGHLYFNASKILKFSNTALELTHEFFVNGTLTLNVRADVQARTRRHSRYARLPVNNRTTTRSTTSKRTHRTLIGAVAITMREMFHRGSAKFAAVFQHSVVGTINSAMAPYAELTAALHASEAFQARYRALTSLSRNLHDKFVARIEQHHLEARLTPFTPAAMPAIVNHTLAGRVPEIGEPNFCNEDFCFECEYIENVVDEFVELLCAVIENFDADIVEASSDFCALTNYTISGTQPTVSDLLDIFSTDGFAEGELDEEIPFRGFPGAQIDKIQIAVLPEGNDIRAAALRIKDFILGTDFDDPGSLVFYGKFLTTCDVVEHARCDRGIQGLGFWNGLVTVLFIYFVAVLLAWLCFPPLATFLIVLLPLLPIVWWVSAYAISPRCLAPAPLAFVLPPPFNIFAMLPITPECVPNDVYCSLRVFEGNCTNIWGALVKTDVCPTAADDFEREFVECSDAPFLFDNVFRNGFYLIERFAPEVNDFLRTTNLLLFSWIREIPLFGEALQFPATGLTDEFAACNINTFFNLFFSVIFLALASTLGFETIVFLWGVLVVAYLALFNILFAPLQFLLLFLIPVVPPKSMKKWYGDTPETAPGALETGRFHEMPGPPPLPPPLSSRRKY